MKLYAWIDSGVVCSTPDQTSAVEGCLEYEVDHEDQLVIVDNEIKIDTTKKRSSDIIKEISILNYNKTVLQKELIDLIIKKEMDSTLGTNYLNSDEYLDKLNQYKNILG
jgi:ATP:corrinoid adenosyltransferase